ncbi:YciI family protein [Variovorax robiniae]|uniref:YciI family protein n=1 Tax=Variovorax robiniae TaxID=1836199 RepID=A0ABU8XBJ9_9BURK
MRFMIIRKADAETESETSPAGPEHAQLLKDMMAYNQAMLDAGIMRGGQGLKPSSAGARVQFKNGKPTVTDGPFAEAKELIAGFTLIEVKSKEEALEWMRRWPASDGHGNVSLELRQLYELEDFEGVAGPELKELEQQMHASADVPR